MLPRTKAGKAERARLVLARLQELHPDAHCDLDHRNAFELLCATVLSAQTTDVAVNKLTPALFARYPNAAALAKAEPAELEPMLSTIGMFRQKSKSLVGLARKICELHGGEVPRTMQQLVQLPGVGRKTANVVLGVAFHTPEGVVVDTHVQRLSQRLRFTKHTEPVEIERALCEQLPRESWDQVSHTLIYHGRRICLAIRPKCNECGVAELCPSAGIGAMKVGRKPPRERRA